jgi:hypothetical protein
MTMVRGALVFGLVLGLLAAAACENTDPSPEEAQSIEEAVGGYLQALAEAYSTLDTGVLEGHASPNEVAAVHKLLKELLQTTGDRIDAELIGFEIETMSVFRGVNATVRLIEVWNITRYGAADGIEKGRFESTIQRTLLQLRLIEERWVIVGRSNLEQETPVAVPEILPSENPE